jgi:GntR family negative regulator for fad regulon and positive regulator of fabA
MTSYQIASNRWPPNPIRRYYAQKEKAMTISPGLPLRPTLHAEHVLIVSILNGTYPPGSHLPSERILAQQIGVTRPTLRETLQRLASDKWITIQHGKPTKINDFWQEGGLSLLSTLAKYSDYLPNGFITHLLELRATLLPTFARLATRNAPHKLLSHLSRCARLAPEAEVYARYDWDLQSLMALHSENPIYLLILNDFASIFHTMAMQYFHHPQARRASLTYYHQLRDTISLGGEAVSRLVAAAMAQSISLWEEINPKNLLRKQFRKSGGP